MKRYVVEVKLISLERVDIEAENKKDADVLARELFRDFDGVIVTEVEEN